MLNFSPLANEIKPAVTGVSGVYEVMIGTDNAKDLIQLFSQFGFSVVKEGQYSAQKSQKLYGVNSVLNSYRLQNGMGESNRRKTLGLPSISDNHLWGKEREDIKKPGESIPRCGRFDPGPCSCNSRITVLLSTQV